MRRYQLEKAKGIVMASKAQSSVIGEGQAALPCARSLPHFDHPADHS